jgi:hypothetical protein
MASIQTVRGLQATAVNTGGVSQILSGLINGRVKVMLDSVALTTDYASGSTIVLGGKIPVGANIISVTLEVTEAQTSLTASVGVSDSLTLFASANDCLQTADLQETFGGRGHVITTGADQILITTGGATATAATLYCTVLYSID